MSSTLPISKVVWLDFLAKHHVLLRRLFANTNFDRTNFDSSCRICILLCSFFFPSVALQECIRADLFVTKKSTDIHVRSCMPNFLVARSASVEWSVTSCATAWSFLFVHCSQRLGTSVLEVECCCCWLGQLSFHVTLGAGLEIQAFRKGAKVFISGSA